jgi:HSP20 family protein
LKRKEAIMAERQDVATRELTEVQAKTREEELALAPPVDIFEDVHGLTVQADMPGVSKERLNVQADRNSLVIEGDMAIDMPASMEALYADVRSTRHRRSFVLSGELETDRIEANLKDGVLRVRIPKRPSSGRARSRCARLDLVVSGRPCTHDRPDLQIGNRILSASTASPRERQVDRLAVPNGANQMPSRRGEQIAPPDTKILAGLLPKSVMHCCARSCSLQRT